MLKYLLLLTMVLNMNKIGNIPLNEKIPITIYNLQLLDKIICKSPVEITYVIHGCASLMIYKLFLKKQGNNYSVELSLPPKQQGILHEYDELIKEVKYYNTYVISRQKLQELESALVPDYENKSTISNYWTIKTVDDSLSLNDESVKNKFVPFINSMIEEGSIPKS